MRDLEALRIGELAARTGTTTPTIRYYESIGLLPRAARGSGAQRRYGAAAIGRLTFIRRCRELGFSLDRVRTLLALIDDPVSDCTDARGIVSGHLASVRARLAELQALEAAVTAFAHECEASSCAGGPGAECVPLARMLATA